MSYRLLLVLVLISGLALVFVSTSRTPEVSGLPAASILSASGALSGLDTDKGIRQFETRVKEDPRDFLSLTILGQLHLRKGREKGDLAQFRHAEESFRGALQLNPNHVPASALLASAYASQHKFSEALQVARELYDGWPASLDALATLADAYLETGQYKEGEAAVKTLTDKAGDIPPILARRARLAELKGRTAEAVALLERAATRTRQDADPAQEIAWYEARLGDVYFHSGCLAESEKHFTTALQLFDTYPIVLSGLADVRVAQGRLQEAADLYRRSVAESPEPRRLFGLGAVEETLGRTDEARRRYEQGEEIARRDVNQAAYYRELAVFYADRLGKSAEALELAQKDLAIRKDVKGYDTLAWALFRNQRFEEAAAAIGEAMKLGTRDPGFYYHAGMIYDALGHTDKSRRYLEQARQMSPQGQRAPTKRDGSATVSTTCNLHS